MKTFPDEGHRAVLRIRVIVPVRVQLRIIERIDVGTVPAIIGVNG